MKRAASLFARVLRGLRSRPARAIGLIGGTLLLVAGLIGPLSRLDAGTVLQRFDAIAIVTAIGLGCLANGLGALAWSILVNALVPGQNIVTSARSFLFLLPMKYLPGSIWNQLGRMSWVTGRLESGPGQASNKPGGFLVALDFGLLLWSGLAVTLLTGLLDPPRSVLARQAPATWTGLMILAGLVTLMLPLGVGALAHRVLGIPMTRSALLVAQLLQMAGWMASAGLLLHLVRRLGGDVAVPPTFGDAMAATWTGMVAGLAAVFVPQGLGVREAVGAALLTPPVLADVAFTAGFLSRLVIMVSDLLGFLIAALSMRHNISRGGDSSVSAPR